MGRKPRTDDTRLLREFLGQYYRAVKRKRQIEERLNHIKLEMALPLDSIRYSPVKSKPSGAVSDGSAKLTLQKASCESLLIEQKLHMEDILRGIIEVLAVLPEDSEERMILELRFIDNYSWTAISRKANMSRSTCFNYRDRGLRTLADNNGVQEVLRIYRANRGQ